MAQCGLLKEPSDTDSYNLELLKEDDEVTVNYRYGQTKFYNATSESGKTGFIDGYCIEQINNPRSF